MGTIKPYSRKFFERQDDIIRAADYMIEFDYGVVKIAEELCHSKSTIHRWITEDLKYIDRDKWIQCKNILKKHNANAVPNMVLGRFKQRRRNGWTGTSEKEQIWLDKLI